MNLESRSLKKSACRKPKSFLTKSIYFKTKPATTKISLLTTKHKHLNDSESDALCTSDEDTVNPFVKQSAKLKDVPEHKVMEKESDNIVEKLGVIHKPKNRSDFVSNINKKFKQHRGDSQYLERLVKNEHKKRVKSLQNYLKSEIHSQQHRERESKKANLRRKRENERTNTVIQHIKNIRAVKKLTPKQRRKARICLKHEL